MLSEGFTNDKIYEKNGLMQAIRRWKLKNKRIVFTNGCFDLLHYGHLATLSSAAARGDILIVGVNSDVSVQRIKGPQRPIKHEWDRMHCLSALYMIDAVILFHEDTPIRLIELIKPDVLVKGGDYEESDVVGAEWVRSYGGEIVITGLIPGKSSTRLIKRMEKDE